MIIVQVRCARLFTLWTKLLPAFLAVVLCSCFVLGTTLVLPELFSGAPLVASCVVAAALFINILFNLAAAVLRSPGTALPCTLSLELALSILQFVSLLQFASCKSDGVYSMLCSLHHTVGNMQCSAQWPSHQPSGRGL